MKFFFLIISVFLVNTIFSQDPSFSLSSENLNYVNPAFTGTSKNMKTGFSYRNQWPGVSGNYITTDVFFDKNLGKYGGVGLTYLHDRAGNTLTMDNLYLDYAYQLKVKETGVLSFGVELGYMRKSLDWSKLIFANSVNPQTGYIYPANTVNYISTRNNFDLGSGLVFYNKYFFASYGAHHLTQPNVSMTGGDSRLSMLHNFYLGGWINLTESITLSPQIDMKMQGNFTNAVAWLKADYKLVQLGLGYRNKDAVLYSIGVKNKNIRVFYCYDVTVSKLSNNETIFTGGSHEIAIQGMLGKKQNERAFRVF